MKMLFKQRFFSWFDSYDIFDENGNTLYSVKGKLAWGHVLHIMDQNGTHIGTVKEALLTWMPKFEIYLNDNYIGCIKKEFTFFHPKYYIDCNGWQINGSMFEWEYTIKSENGSCVAEISKELFCMTDTYVIDVVKQEDALIALMLVLAIDAEKCSRN